MKIIDLKKTPKFLKQYLTLRNKCAILLLTKKATLKETREWLKKAPVEIRCLIEEKELLGVVILYQDKNNEIAVFVKEPGQGLGKRLLSIIEKVAQTKKITKLFAWALTSNIPVQWLFERCGYKKEGLSKKNFKGKIFHGYVYGKTI